MRIETLILERFGIFADATLDFGDGRGLHVIYGPNEAGKSTALAAIGDLLFGIEERTPYEFRFGYGKLRIGAKIVQSNGTRLEFKRRKARTGSLISLSSPETPMADAALEPFLGAVDRDRFQFLFGLDQERLRKGGREMLNPQGNFGQTLFAAGTGLESVNQTLAELDAEIKEIGSLNDRRTKSAIWTASDRYIEAIKAKRADGLAADVYQGAEKKRDALATQRREIVEQLSKLRARRNFLERGLKVGPSLDALARLRAELAEFAGAPDLPEDFAEQWKQADDAARSAREAAERRAAEVENLMQKLALAPPPQRIVEFAREIDSLNERLGKYLGDLDDVPKLAGRIVDHDEAIATSLRALGLAVDPSAVETILPNKIIIARIRELITQSAVVRAEVKQAEAGIVAAKASFAEAQSALQVLPPVLEGTEAAELVDQANKLGDVGKSLALAKAEAETADLALSEALKRLKLAPEAAGELASMPVPDAATVKAFGERWSAGLQQRAALDKALDEAARASLEIDAALRALAVAGEVPTAQAISEARDIRDAHWRRIRDAIVAGGAAEIERIGAYETAVRHADSLVDRREAEAQRIAQLASLTAERQKAGDAVTRIVRQIQVAAAEIQALEAEWPGLWPSGAVSVGSPSEMLKWLAGRDEALRLRGESAKAAQNLRLAAANAQQAENLLRQAAQILCLVEPAAGAEALERQLRRALKGLQAEAGERSKAEIQLETARGNVEKAGRAGEEASKAAADWRAAWASAVLAIGLPGETSSAQAEAALAAWDAILLPLSERKNLQRRHKGLCEDLAQFRAEAARLVGELAEPGLPEAPVDKIVRALKARLDDAKSQTQARAALTKSLAEARVLADEANEKSRQTLSRLAALRKTNAIEPEADAYALARQAARRRALQAQIEDRARDLAELGESVDEAALRLEVSSLSPDEARAELATIKDGENPLIEQLQALTKEETEAAHEIAALGARRGAAFADQEARNAVAAAGGLVERWLRLEIARRLLERSVRRYQDENQDPMIKRASDIFAQIASSAANPIERITIDYRNAAKPVPIGLRRDGSDCGLEGLSEATRDQLFLSLRVAAIEKFCSSHEPMPFIADDLFMTSDEQRVKPLLQILAELGRTTQVIAFTHHRHVFDIAQSLSAKEVRTHVMPALSISPG